jgi:hypothetical protein
MSESRTQATIEKATDQPLMRQCWRVSGYTREEIAWAIYLLEKKLERAEPQGGRQS